MKPANIVVVGSINMDLISRMPRLPKPGETLAGQDLLQVPGGKGANQAVAASRLGGRVHMVGRVGDDAFGPVLRAGLETSGVDTSHVKTSRGASGVAVILLQSSGENSIVLSGGANARVTRADVDAARDVLAAADIVMLQLEIPIVVAAYAARLCRQLGVRVILDPAPAIPKLPPELFAVHAICPNETEAMQLLGGGRGDVAKRLLARGAENVILKLGGEGSMHTGRGTEVTRQAAFEIDVVDTTAAGDAMTAGIAVAVAEGKAWPDVLRFANAAGALACTKLGAQHSLPTRSRVTQLIRASA